jgi:hypothetical protein
MKRLFWLFFLLRLVYAAVPQSFTVKAGRYTAGKFQSVLAQNIVVTVSGTQTATTDRRILVAFPLTNTSTPTIYLAPGTTGSCTGGTCSFVTLDTADSLASCDIYSGQWPKDAQGLTGVIMVGCVDTDPTGSIWRMQNAVTAKSRQGAVSDEEGCQCIQGPDGPGPLTWRGNDTFFLGNPVHFANEGGQFSHKHDYWIYRNRVNPYWGGMWHQNNPERDGNIYGARQQQFEWKGGTDITFEGNWFTGGFQSRSGAANSTVIVFRNENDEASRLLIMDNVFEHQPGLFLSGDLNYNSNSSYQGATNRDFMAINNVSWDINQKGPDTTGIGGGGAWTTPAGVTGGYSDVTAGNRGYGWTNQGPSMQEGLAYLQNTFPDHRGGVAALNYTYGVPSGGLYYGNNFMSMTKDNNMNFLGIKAETAVENCGTASGGFAYLSCYYSGGYQMTGNVWLSRDQTKAAIEGDGWGTGNTTPTNPADLPGIWPNYTVKDWHYDLDPETYRVPLGSPYMGKGADITRLRSALGMVDQPQALFDASNNLVVTWLAPDAQACSIDTSATGDLINGFTRNKADTGVVRVRKITIPAAGFTADTTYKVRINCEREAPVLTTRSN